MRTRLVGSFTRVRLAALGALLAALSATALATTLVSDAGGYKATDVTVFSFIDVSGGGATVLTGSDDDKVALTLPFAFTFFGHAYPMVCVSSNGAAYFIDAEAECGAIPNDFANVDLTQAPSPGDRAGIFPLWSDLVLPGAGTGVAYQTQGDSPHRKFVLQWNNAYPLSNKGGGLSAPVTFEVILLEENNQILFQYNTVDLGADPASNGGLGSVGIRNAGALVALNGGVPNPTFGEQIAWSYNSPVLANGKAILFTSGKSTPVVTATGGNFPYNGSTHAGSGAAYGTGGLSDVLSPAVTLSYAGIPPTVYAPTATAPAAQGTYEVTANFAGSADYTSGSGTAPLTITPGSQAITFTSSAPAAATAGGATYAASATGGASGNPVTFSSLTTEVCASSGPNGSTISFVAAGTCIVAADQDGNANYDPAPHWPAPGGAMQSFSVGKGAQTINITSTAPSAATVGGSTYSLAATGGLSGNPVTFSSLTTGVCTVGGNGFSVSFLIVGSCQVAADQAGDLNYDAATQKTQTFNVGKGAQTITFTSSVPLSAVVGGPTYAVAATGGASGNVVTFTSLTTLVCTASGGDGSPISFIAVGNCQVAANQAGNTNYNAAGQQTQTFAVGEGGTQTITFTSTPPLSPVVDGPAYLVTATGGASGNAVTFTSLSTGVCTASGLNGFTISFIAVGTCQVAANQLGNGTYTAAVQQTQSFAVGKGTQAITFTSTAPAAAKVGGATYAAAATGGASNNAVTFTSLTTLVCTVSGTYGSTINFLTPGNCQVAANQLGNGTYNAAPQQTQIFSVGKGAQTINFTSTVPAAAKVGGTYAAAATSSASLTPVTFSSLTTGVCTAGAPNGATISFVAVGTCQVAADQLGNANYDAAPQQTQSFAVGKGTQTIGFTSTVPAAAKVGGTYAAAATSSASLTPVTFSSLTTLVCTSGGTNGATISFIAVGSCQVAADQLGNANYDAAPQQTQSFAVGKGTQTIGFTSTVPAAAKVGGTYAAAATSSASLTPVTFSSLTTLVCTSGGTNGATISFIAVGSCQVAADQAGNTNYDAAPQQTQIFSVGTGAQTINFTSTVPAAAKVGGTYAAAATSSASLTPVTFSSLTTLVCTSGGTNGATISFIAVGSCQVAADQAGNTNYDAAPQQTQIFSVGTGAQTINFTSTVPAAAKVGGTYAAAATSSASLTPVTFSSLTTLVCTSGGTNGATISFIAVGPCTVAADQLGNANYDAAPQQTQNVTVVAANTGAPTTTTVASDHNPGDFTQALTITATVKRTSNNTAVTGGTVTFNEGIAVLAGPIAVARDGKVSFKSSTLSAGNHTITAYYSGSPSFAPSSASVVQVVTKESTKIELKSSNDSSRRNENVTFTATVRDDRDRVIVGTVTFKEGAAVLAGPIALDANGKASFSKSNLSAGEHTITAVYNGTANYETTSASVKQKVK